MAAAPEELAGCTVAFTTVDAAEAALDAGVDDVLACSLTPFATRLTSIPPMVLDAAAEIPSYGDHFGGRPRSARLTIEGVAYAVPALELSATDRVLTSLDPRTPLGLGALLSPLAAGAALVLLVSGAPAGVIAQEQVTVIVDESGVRRL